MEHIEALHDVLSRISKVLERENPEKSELRPLFSEFLSSSYHVQQNLEKLIGHRQADTSIPGWGAKSR